MEGEGEASRGRWSTAVALTIAVVFLSVFDAVPLVALPLAALMMALPVENRLKWIVGGLLLWMAAAVLPGGTLGTIGRGWALVLGGAFLFVTLTRPSWGVLPRALTAVAASLAAGALWIVVSGSWQEVDALVREHFQQVSTVAMGDLAARAPGSSWVQDLSAATERMAALQWTLFPALLALQSLAALALASWWLARLRYPRPWPGGLRPLREFRFNDQLVWLLVGGILLLAFPMGALATRAGYNVLLFMGSLYAVRGVGVFAFLIGGAPSWLAVVFGVLATIFLYPLVLTAVLLVGLGDTWLDVRRRAALSAPRG